MAPCCFGSSVREFTFLLIHVLHVSHPAALEGSTRYAREIVDRFFSKYTQIDLSYIEPHNHKFRNLIAESRLEIAFAGRPKGFKVPNYKVYRYEHSEGLAVVFEVETRLIKRYIPPTCDFDLMEIERTDYLPLSGCAQRQVADMRVSYMNM
jgi:hypothetical protein